MEIDNIRFAMFEIYDKYKQGKISQEVAEYFVSHLDSVQRKNGVQNLSQVIYDYEHAEIGISFANVGETYVFEREHGKLVRELFFMDQGEKYPIYLGDIIKLNKNVENRLERFLGEGIYEPLSLEIEIDTWPMIPPYVEVEGKSEEEIYKFIELLGYSKEDVKVANTSGVYAMYGINIYDFKELKFD